MSAAAAEDAGSAPAPKKVSKKLIIIIAAVAVLLLGGGGAAFYVIKKSQAEAEAEEGEDGEAPAKSHAKADKKKDDHKAPPTFVALEPFTINLADKDHERFGQIGVTLEVDDPKFAEQMKAYMPAIRAGILMVLAHKTSEELLTREGKDKLAGEIMRESVKPMGIEIEDEHADEEEADDDSKKKKKKKKKKVEVHNPVQRVLFSSFIIQ